MDRSALVWAGVISSSFSLAAIALSFMLEKLFLEEFPWWAWGIVAVVSSGIGVIAALMQAKRISKMANEWEVVAYHGEPLNVAEMIMQFITFRIATPTKRIPKIIRNKNTGEVREVKI